MEFSKQYLIQDKVLSLSILYGKIIKMQIENSDFISFLFFFYWSLLDLLKYRVTYI